MTGEAEPYLLEKRRAVFEPRDEWPLREGVAAYRGHEVIVAFAGSLTAEERPQYAGETIWNVVEPEGLARLVAWLAEGDLRFLPAAVPADGAGGAE